MSRQPNLEESCRTLVTETRKVLGDPPSTEELLAYHAGKLPAKDTERIKEYLTFDPSTLDRFLDLTAHSGDPGDLDYLTEDQLAEDWAKLAAQLDIKAPEAATASPAKILPFPFLPDSAQGRALVTKAVALAAMLAFAVLGLWLVTLRQRVDQLSYRLSEPRLNETYEAILPDGHRRRGPAREPSAQGAEHPIHVSLGEGGIHLALALYEATDFERYRLNIYEGRGAEGAPPLWTTDALIRQADDSFRLGLPPGFLSPGGYLFRLYGLGEGQETLVATYTILLTD